MGEYLLGESPQVLREITISVGDVGASWIGHANFHVVYGTKLCARIRGDGGRVDLVGRSCYILLNPIK
jgi:hypothetical protein